jgi:large conductance mechanosensitive channel
MSNKNVGKLISKSGIKFVNEFKKFALRGNVIDLAVGVIIGGAFQKIVSSIVNDLIMPLIGFMTGSINFNDRFAVLSKPDGVKASDITSLEMAKELGVSTLNYGAFLTAVLDFLIMAIVIFFMVKLVNRISEIVKKGDETPPPAVTKLCEYCQSEINIKASRCPHCTSQLEN